MCDVPDYCSGCDHADCSTELVKFDQLTCGSCKEAGGRAWCAAGSLCAAAPLPASMLQAGDAAVCPTTGGAWSATADGCGANPFGALDPLFMTNMWAYRLINVFPAWAAGVSGRGVTVNIVDAGPDVTHPDFASKYDASGSCQSAGGPVREITDDQMGHGTTTAAIALGAANDHCSHGIAFGATLTTCDLGDTVKRQLTSAPRAATRALHPPPHTRQSSALPACSPRDRRLTDRRAWARVPPQLCPR